MEDFVVQGKGPKRVGALYVTCQLFKVYFKVRESFLVYSLYGVVDICIWWCLLYFVKFDSFIESHLVKRCKLLKEQLNSSFQNASSPCFNV